MKLWTRCTTGVPAVEPLELAVPPRQALPLMHDEVQRHTIGVGLIN